MKLDPIDPQKFTQYEAYQEKKRTHWERFLDKVKPRSAAMRTTVLVLFVVLFSLFMSLFQMVRNNYFHVINRPLSSINKASSICSEINIERSFSLKRRWNIMVNFLLFKNDL